MPDLEDAVFDLLKSLEKTVKENVVDEDNSTIRKKIKDIDEYLGNMTVLAKKCEKTHISQLKDLDSLLRNCDHGTFVSTLDCIKTYLRETVYQLKHMPLPTLHGSLRQGNMQMSNQSQNEQATSEREKKILEDAGMKSFQVSYNFLQQPELKLCLLLLSIFPENEVIKKRPLIYWWIGEGLITQEEEGEQIFEDLLKHDLIIPHYNGKSPIVKQFQIHPWIRYMLISLARRAQIFALDSSGMPCSDATNSTRACLLMQDAETLSSLDPSKCKKLKTIFNVNESYLNFESLRMAELKKLVVLHLGRWQASPTHHIEVESEAFLKALTTHKNLKYLSLRGVSKITRLPGSVLQLSSLEILDLKACHSLESLPSNIGKLRKLTHLDVSECYLLQSMPKGIQKLTSLQVLKGFIIGDSNKITPCRIKDLEELKQLKRLSIYIGSETIITQAQDGVLDKLENLKSLICLKVSWAADFGKLSDQQSIAEQSFSFPASLEKLVLEALPHKSVPNWLKPSKLQGLKKLYIKGGELNSLDHKDSAADWKVEILQLSYLKNLKIDWLKMRNLFPSLTYVRVMPDKKAPGSSQLPDHAEWRKYWTK